jgi:hypothetical protein
LNTSNPHSFLAPLQAAMGPSGTFARLLANASREDKHTLFRKPQLSFVSQSLMSLVPFQAQLALPVNPQPPDRHRRAPYPPFQASQAAPPPHTAA